MDGRYPGSSFEERRDSSGETADWAFSSSTAVSSSYSDTHMATEILHRQSYTSSNNLPTYTTSHHPTGVSGVFDTSLHNSSTTESSILNFLASIDSRGLQTGPAATSVLPQFRTTPWQTGTNSSTELFLTGVLPSSGTFSTMSGLSSYQHPSTFPTRSFGTTSALGVRHTTYSPSNGLLSPNDPLLQIKPSHTTVPTAFAFDRLSGASLGTNLPVQSSTYRSAQESAPHLLQPQFNLLPSSLASSQQTTQAYGAPIFSSSLERALQRECSVIKHHQRPSSTQPVLSASTQHSLQNYFPDGTDSSFQDSSRHTPVPNSPSGLANGSTQQKAQSCSPSIPSPAFSSTSEVKDDSNKTAEHLEEVTELHDKVTASHMPQHSYASIGQKQSSGVANQSKAYTSAQLTSLMAISPAQTYITSQTLSNHTDAQVFSPSQSENVSSVSQSLIFSSGQEQILSSAANTGYNEQVQEICMGNPSHSYSSSHSPATVSYYDQGLSSVSLTKSYSSVQSLPNSSPYSSSPHSLPTLQEYHLMQPTPSSKSDNHLVQQPQKYCQVQSAASSTATYTQALQSTQSSDEQKPAYSQAKQEENGFHTSSDSCGELPLQDVQALQQSSTPTDSSSNVRVQSNIVYVVSKTDDRQLQSVIRSNSRSEDELLPVESKKQQRTLSDHVHLESGAHNGTKDSSLTQSSQLVLKEPRLLLKSPSVQHEIHQIQSNRIQQVSQEHAHFVQLPSGQVLLDSSQKILMQHPLLATEQNQSKAAVQMQPVSVQFLPLNNEILNSSVGMRGTQQLTHQALETGKQPVVQRDHFSSSSLQDAKQHFALSSICFPESMLMADEKTILSNMDDILAATAAACGVTPQDFKASEGDLASISNPTDTKCHFQLDGSQQEDGFSSQHMMGNTQALTLNGGQLMTDLDKGAGEHQGFTSANSQCQLGNSKQGMSEQMVEHCDKKETLAKELPCNDSLNSNGHSHSDYDPAAQEYTSTGLLNQPKGVQSDTVEDVLTEDLSEVLSKKRAKLKGFSKQSVDDQNGQPKSQKRSGQVKRQNSKGSETGSSSDGYLDGYQQQERIRQIIKEVEEKQPEVKTGFIGSFLDFLKSGPKQNNFSPSIRSPNRVKKPPVSKKLTNPMPVYHKPQLVSADISNDVIAKKVQEELQKNLQSLPTFSSDEEESARKNHDLQKSISCALSSLDELTDKKLQGNRGLVNCTDHGPPLSGQSAETPPPVPNEVPIETLLKNVPPNKLAVRLNTVAVEGLTDDELVDSGGEGMYRERDEFVVRNEDIESLQITLKAGIEPPAIWKVQKALLQKFTPELRDGKRVFSATNSYLGYFGDAKTMYRRVYVKFLDTVNKREYVRVCNRKPKCRPMHSMRGSQMKAQLTHKPAASLESDSSTLKQGANQGLSKPRPKQMKSKAEPPPKKRKKWKEEFTVSPELASDREAVSEDDEFTPPVPFATRFLNTRTMKETFKCFVELLIIMALDADIMLTLERENDELLLPHMKRVDGMITDNRRRLLAKLRVGQVFKNALDSFPELSMVTELQTDGETPTFKIRLGGKTYNKKTMKPTKSHNKVPPEYPVEQQKTQWFSLYHSLQHYKYHTYLLCMKEIALLRSRGVNLGQEETVQTCMGNQAWVEGLFDRFGELLTQVQQACL